MSHVVVFKSGKPPADEKWYLKQVFAAINVSATDVQDSQVNIYCVQQANLDQAYVVGFATQAGHDLDSCSLTPFFDADGGSGLVLKVKGGMQRNSQQTVSSRKWWQFWR